MTTLETTSTLGFAASNGLRPGRPAERRLAYLINEALGLGRPAGPYRVSQVLAAEFPTKHVLEVADRSFNPFAHARAGNATTEARSVPHARTLAHLHRDEDVVRYHYRQGWFRVDWDGQSLEMLVIHTPAEPRSDVWCYWLLADSKTLADAYFADVCRWNLRLRGEEILVYDGYAWEKDKKMMASVRSATFDTLVLDPDIQAALLRDVRWFFEARNVYERYGAPWKRGILFVGPPGNGKTHTIKAVINDMGSKCLYVQRFGNEGSVAEVFDRAREMAPCVLVLEDIDSVVKPKMRSLFLNQLDGFHENSGILTVASSNHPERLDPAISERPSRFDRKYSFPDPNESLRREYLCRWNGRLETEVRLSHEFLGELVAEAAGFSFAYLQELVTSSIVWWVSAEGALPIEEVFRRTLAGLKTEMKEAKRAN